MEHRLRAASATSAALAEGVLGRDAGAAPKFSAEGLQGLLAPLAGAMGTLAHQ